MLFKKSLAAILALMVTIASFNLCMPAAAAGESLVTTQAIYTSASSWAKPEIAKAYDYGLIPDDILSKQSSQPATREELCELAAVLYEKTMKTTAVAATPNPFTDTDNPQILKAYALGITTGTSPTTFSPGYLTTREQVATMFSRAIRVMFPSADYSTDGAPAFNDQKDISSWALSHVLYMSKAGIIKGSNNMFMPRALTDAQAASGYGTTTREQAIAISVRIYETYGSSGTNTNTDDAKDKFAQSFIFTSMPTLSETQKLSKIDFNNRIFRPIYHPQLTLSAESGATAYSKSPWSSLVSPDGDRVQTFKLSLPATITSQTSSIVWQVSVVPFDGGAVKSSSAKPGGLLLSGTLSGSATQFDVNFAKVLQAENTLRHTSQIQMSSGLASNLQISGNFTLPGSILSSGGTVRTYGQTSTPLRTYYVRAFPVDASGNSIGDAGAGLPVLYGDPLPLSSLSSSKWQIPAINSLFSLKPAKGAGNVKYDGEFPNTFVDANEVVMLNTSSTKTYSVLPAGFSANTQELRIQVSLTKYSSSSGDNWLNTPGLVYETSIFPGDTVYKDLANAKTSGIAIDFSKFVPSDSELPKSEYVQYFVRAVALTPSSQPGTLNASYSKTVTIDYGFSQATPPQFLAEVKITPPIPTIEKVSYTPVQWERQGWQYHYVVTRQPTTKEVFGSFFGDDLYGPYTVGTKLDLTPQPENKSWWEEAWDSITSFFSSIGDFLVKVVNWVSNAYADLKSGLIDIIVSALPPSWQGPLRTALTAIVDYGLASMGIPPTLPNFDQLADMGTEYLATLAMEQAGVPADSLVEYGVDELSDEIGDSLSDSATASSPNPMDWNFVQLDPDYLYRPAYLTVELYNPYGKPTPAGKLYFSADKFLDTSKNGSDQGVTRMLSAYGSSYVCLYKPVYGMEIPSLYPGQHLSVPVILEEYVGVPFPGCTAPVQSVDYATIYGGLGEYNFSLFIQYELPPIMEEAAAQGYTGDAIYSYSALGNGRSFTLLPGTSYSK